MHDGIGGISASNEKWPYLYTGMVHSVADPHKAGAVEVIVPAVCGQVPIGFARPLTAIGGGTKDGRGLFAVPPVGSMVGILFENGDVESPFYLPGWFPSPQGTTAAPPPSTGAAGDPGKIVWRTTKWVALLVDDDSNKLRIESRDDPLLFMEFNGANGKVTFSTGALKDLLLGAAGATEQVILGNAFMTLYNAHTHTETGGVTTTPVVPMSTTQLSSKVKVAT